MKHTPGPWKAYGCATYQEDIWENGNNVGGLFIAELPENFFPSDERLANARLIAAAPELLEALDALLDCPDLNLDELEVETRTAIFQARRAIEKATN